MVRLLAQLRSAAEWGRILATSFSRKSEDSGKPPGRNPEMDFKGQPRCNDTHASPPDADEMGKPA